MSLEVDPKLQCQCPACRQLLAEYASDAKVFVADSRRLKAVKEFSVRELLPGAFLDFRPA